MGEEIRTLINSLNFIRSQFFQYQTHSTFLQNMHESVDRSLEHAVDYQSLSGVW